MPKSRRESDYTVLRIFTAVCSGFDKKLSCASVALQMSGYWNWAVRSIVDIEVQMTAVQRIHEYCTIPSERHSSPGTCSSIACCRPVV